MTINQYKHLIFFDSKCSLCRSSIVKIIKIDLKELFCFSPLTGSTAKEFLKGKHQKLIDSNSLILIENFSKDSKKYWIRSKGFFRILWLIGGFYKIFGSFYILPSFLTAWVYRTIARHRHKFFKNQDHVPFITKDKKRFLP